MSEPQAVHGLRSLPCTGTGSEESEVLMEQGPEPGSAMLASPAARRLEAQGDANDACGIRTAFGCGSVRDEASMTSHRAATTAAHTHCTIVPLRELGISQPQSQRWEQGGSREAMVEPCLNTRDWGDFLPDLGPPGPAFPLPVPIGCPGTPREGASVVLCAPLFSPRVGSWL